MSKLVWLEVFYDKKGAFMDLERVEHSVEQCPLQEWEYRHPSGIYVLSHDHLKPAWWSVGYRATEHAEWTWQTCRGLQAALTLIEQTYPLWYAWLLSLFSTDG